MALHPNVTPADAESKSIPAIENELPAYRAISPHAVVGLIAGVLAVISFASPYFLSFAVAAILLGVYADRKIHRYPDVRTGLGLAHAAIALGLVFGLASITTTTVQSVVRKAISTRFAKQMAHVLQTSSVAEAVWFTVYPDIRDGKPAEEIYKELMRQSRGPAGMNPGILGIEALKKRLASTPGQELHFVKIEQTGIEDLDIVARALMEIDGPPSAEYPDKEQFALVVVRGRTIKGRLRWWAESILFPYKPDSFVDQTKHVDDGHGHAH